MYEVGTTFEKTWIVEDGHLASAFGSGLADVLATPVLIGFCEETCRSMIDPHLPAGRITVGTEVSLRHTAATPPGLTVRIVAELISVNGRRLSFSVSCEDDVEPIGRGTHERAIIDTARFDAGIAKKMHAADPS
jgi:predicted thioesterase